MSFICKVIGHKPKTGEIRMASIMVAHTHSRDTHCARCRKFLYWEKMYFDALTQPIMFDKRQKHLWDYEAKKKY